MTTIRKLEASVAYPINKNSNQIYWNIGQEDGVIDLKQSYVELELQLSNLTGITGAPSTDAYNVVTGRDGVFYEPSCFVRQCRLADTSTGKVMQDLNYVNTIDCNLKYFNKGCNEMVQDAIFSGAGHRGPDGVIYSSFNNSYPDENPVVKVPLSSVLVGSLGQSEAVPQHGAMELRWLCEPQQSLFMRAVPDGKYNEPVAYGPYSFANINQNIDVATPLALGTIENFAQADTVLIQGTLNGVSKSFVRTITAIVDDGITAIGNMTLSSSIDATYPLTGVTIEKETVDSPLACVPLAATGATLTLATPYPVLKSDISVGTVVDVHYTTLINGVLSTSETVDRRTIASNGINITGTNVVSVVLDAALTVPASSSLINMYIVPLYTNLAADWSIVNSHVVLYRHNMKGKPSQKMLLSNFENQGVQCIAGLGRFIYNFKIDNNAHNVYVLTPTADNLYSQVQTFDTYLMTVDETPLTSIYVDTPDSAVHIDNMNKTLQNSPTYKPKNLSKQRDSEIAQDVEPVLFPAKIKFAMVAGMPLLEPEGKDKNLRVELTSNTSTQAMTVFMFAEKWVQL